KRTQVVAERSPTPQASSFEQPARTQPNGQTLTVYIAARSSRLAPSTLLRARCCASAVAGRCLLPLLGVRTCCVGNEVGFSGGG
ncbi:unnamed protein product, partial [Tilletia laevis]